MADEYKYSKASEPLLDEETVNSRWNVSAETRKHKAYAYVFLVLSLLSNVLLASYFLLSKHESTTLVVDRPTPYAGLVFDTPSRFTHVGPFNEPNNTQPWIDLHFDLGNLALPDSYSTAKGLPEAQRFVWDESKGLYFINAFHAMHCLKILHTTLYELTAPVPVLKQNLSWPFSHSIHCLDALLQDTKCYADDTPRYEALAHPGQPGDNQPRMCRDWNKLEEYAREYSACWRDVNPTEHGFDLLKRYRYCPKGSPYWEKIREAFPDVGEWILDEPWSDY